MFVYFFVLERVVGMGWLVGCGVVLGEDVSRVGSWGYNELREEVGVGLS